jgi:hypothetical protein
LSATLPGGYWFFQPSIHQWHTHTIPATTNPRERAFTSSTRWIFNEISLRFTGDSVDVTGAWYIETVSTGAGIVPSIVPIVGDVKTALPPKSPSPMFPDDPLALYPVDDPANELDLSGIVNQEPASNYPPGHEEEEPGVSAETALNTQVLKVSMLSGTPIVTTRATVNGETYTVRVDGDGVINATTVTDDFTASDGGWFLSPILVPTQGVYVAATGWRYTDFKVGGFAGTRQVGIRKNLTAQTVTRVSVTYDYENGGFELPINSAFLIILNDAGGVVTSFAIPDSDMVDGTGVVEFWAGTEHDITSRDVRLMCYYNTGIVVYAGNALITEVAITAAQERGDAFYEGYDTATGATLYAGSNGLQVDGARPAGITAYNAAHTYEFTVTGTGSTFSFRFLEGDYTDNSNSYLRVSVTGPNMGLTA